MNSPTLRKKPIQKTIMDLMDEINGQGSYTLRNGSKYTNTSTSIDKPTHTITNFKYHFLVGKKSNDEKKVSESTFFTRVASNTAKSDFGSDILKKLNKRQEHLFLKTEYNPVDSHHQMEQRKRQIVSLLNSGKFTQYAKTIQQQQKIMDDSKTKSKVLMELGSMKKRLDSKNTYPK